MSDKNDDQFEHDDLIDSLYQDSAGEQPPAKIDNLILAKAKGQTVSVKNPRKPRWALPLAAVCVPALALGVVLKVGTFNFSDASYEPTSSGVYDTNDFVLHIPEQDAASQIKRIEKPVFNDSNPNSLAHSNATEEADIVDAEMRATMEQQTAAAVTREQQSVLAETRQDTANDDAYSVEIRQVEATTQSSYENRVYADAVVAEPPVLNETEMMELPLAKTEALDQNTLATSGSVVADAQKEEIIVTGARVMPESVAAAELAMPALVAPQANSGVVAARSAPATDQTETDESLASDLADAFENCPELRPEVCNKIYQPVCGQRDTGIRCVMAPCDEAVEWRDYGNQCSACADQNVYGYHEGSCESLNLPVE